MKRRSFIYSLSTLALAIPLSSLLRIGAQEKKIKILYFTRSAGFEHDAVKRTGQKLSFSELILQEIGDQIGIEVECTKDGSVFDKDLSQYAAIALYATGDLTRPTPDNTPPMTLNGKKQFLQWVENGGGVIGFHAATDAFHAKGKEIDPFIQMIGGEFLTHGEQQTATIRVVSPNFPGMKNVPKEFTLHEEWYVFKNFAQDLHVILLQDTKGMKGEAYQRAPYPQTWARIHGKGRVFYTSFGHREDIWRNPIVQQVIIAGLQWVCRRVDADVTPNVEEVAPGVVAASRA